jgi:hypothetical protein
VAPARALMGNTPRGKRFGILLTEDANDWGLSRHTFLPNPWSRRLVA